MPKFLSHDGLDKNGIRAEVMVQTGTGRITEIVGRGKQSDDGSYRNVEIVFDPDNPLLKRKVYGLLDTTAGELWAYIKKAHEDGRTVSYRIESQRRNGVDRGAPLAELNPTEQIRRILASIDGVFSHEAKTNPVEDPSNENPSALTQNLSAAATSTPGPAVSLDAAISALQAATVASMPSAVINALAAQALLAGVPSTVVAEYVSSGQNPAEASDSLDSPAVACAAQAEQFALDHLISIYTPAKSKESVSVSDEMLAQAASVAIALLDISDTVHAKFVHGIAGNTRASRSYAHALNLVIDGIDKRYPVPVGGNDQAQTEWREAVTGEALERLYGLTQIAQGKVPQSEEQRYASVQTPSVEDTVAESADVETSPALTETEILEEISVLKSSTELHLFQRPRDMPEEGQPGFEMPDAATVARLRGLCESAEVTHDTKAISDWIERRLGVRSARKVHSPALVAFCDFYEAAGSDQVRLEVLQAL